MPHFDCQKVLGHFGEYVVSGNYKLMRKTTLKLKDTDLSIRVRGENYIFELREMGYRYESMMLCCQCYANAMLCLIQ